jgi:hypothetical protein
MRSKAKINKQNTRHGKMDMPFASLNKYAGMAKGGDVKKEMKAAGIFAKAGEKKLAAHERREAMGKEKDTPAMAKKEMSVLKKAKAPKDVMDYEKKEHKAMGFARGGGIESKGKTRGKFFAEGGDVEDDTDAEGYGTKITRVEPEAKKSQTFSQAFREARAKGAGTEFTWNGKKIAAYREGEGPSSKKPTVEGPKMSSDGPMSRKALGTSSRSAPTMGEALAARFGSAGQRAEAKKEGRGNAFSGRFGTAEQRRRYEEGMASGGSIKKYARGGGIESKGKTRGKFI